MSQSQTIGSLTTALAKAQAAFLPAKRTGKVDYDTRGGGRKTYNYAPLENIFDACRKALSDNELAIMQPIKIIDGQLIVETLLSHSSGEWVASEIIIGSVDTAPQSQGSALTYARRYSLSALLGIASEEDDDAEAAMPDREGTKETTRRHWCSIHHAVFFKKGKMPVWAHPIAGTDKWCNEPSPVDTEESSSQIAQAKPETVHAVPDELEKQLEETEAPDIPSDSPPVDLDWLRETLDIIHWTPGTAIKWLNAQFGEAPAGTLRGRLKGLDSEELAQFTDHITIMREELEGNNG